MDSAYKADKEAFVSGLTGSTVGHINTISLLVAFLSVAVHAGVQSRLNPRPSPLLSFAILVLPLLLGMTLLADAPGVLIVGLGAAAVGLYAKAPKELDSPLPSRSPAPSAGFSMSPARVPPLPALSTFRAHMLLMTILAILAVDFPVFPRELAKCETFGVSLMDVGVGSFVFAAGIVSALLILKDPAYLRAPTLPKVLSVARKAAPIIALGLVRVALVKGTEYPEHVTEYGVHWNFFITLAVVPVLQVLLHPVIARGASVSWLAVLVGMAQQALLTVGGLDRYVLYAPRNTLISQNKEGIVSLLGYLSIHLLGLATGTLILPPSPSYFRRMQRGLNSSSNPNAYDKPLPPLSLPREDDKTATELFGYTLLWWALFYLARYFKIGGQDVSRRMVNLPYILWVAAYNTTAILGYFALDLLFFPRPERYDPTSGLKRSPGAGGQNKEYAQAQAPALLEAINKNGLALFLLANLLTGIINLTTQTMYASNTKAMIILTAYAGVVCWVAWAVRVRRVVKL
ncbi:GWT1-domain-containing protein [Schizophyllum commune]